MPWWEQDPVRDSACLGGSRTLSAIQAVVVHHHRAQGAAPTSRGGAGPCPRFSRLWSITIAHGVRLLHVLVGAGPCPRFGRLWSIIIAHGVWLLQWQRSLLVLFVHPLAVSAALHVGHPLGVAQVPLDGFADAGVEGFGGFPAEFFFELAGVDGVAAVMAWAVGHVGDLTAVAAAVGLGAHFVEKLANSIDDLDVGLFVPATDVVGLAQAAGFQHAAEGAAVVLHIQPVTDLHAVAVDGQVLAGQCVDDHQGDEFFGEMVGAVVVAAVGGQHGQAIGVVPGADQVVGCGFAGTVGAVWFVAVRLGKGRIVFAERAIDLVGGHVQKAERLPCRRGPCRGSRTLCAIALFGQAHPISAHRLQQAEGAHDVGLDEVTGAVDGAVDVALGREVDHGAGLVLGQQAADQGGIANVALHKDVAFVALQAGQCLGVAGVGEFVEVDNGLVAACEPVKDKVSADEAGTAGDKNGHLKTSVM